MRNTNKVHTFHLRRFGLFCLLFLALAIVKVDAGALSQSKAVGAVLSYATEMSRSALLSGTNAARSSNGLGALTLDSQLNSSAQSKAQHMATNNYWAHVAPDGTQPWYFFDNAGYSYIRAGENLAYGFTNSQATIDGWMNSASHKANILGNYNDVGFGIVDSPNFQGGEQTIVVAHYGSKSSPAPSAAPTSSTAPLSTPAPAPQSNPTNAPLPAPAPEVTTVSETPEPTDANASDSLPPQSKETTPNVPATTTQAKSPKNAAANTPIQTGAPSSVSLTGLVASGRLPAAVLVSFVVLSISVIGYALTHRAAFTHAVYAGEHFALRHPGVDSAMVVAIVVMIALTSYGQIQ